MRTFLFSLTAFKELESVEDGDKLTSVAARDGAAFYLGRAWWEEDGRAPCGCGREQRSGCGCGVCLYGD